MIRILMRQFLIAQLRKLEAEERESRRSYRAPRRPTFFYNGPKPADELGSFVREVLTEMTTMDRRRTWR